MTPIRTPQLAESGAISGGIVICQTHRPGWHTHVPPASGSHLEVTTEVLPEHEGNTERDCRDGERALDLLIPVPRAFRRDN